MSLSLKYLLLLLTAGISCKTSKSIYSLRTIPKKFKFMIRTVDEISKMVLFEHDYYA